MRRQGYAICRSARRAGDALRFVRRAPVLPLMLRAAIRHPVAERAARQVSAVGAPAQQAARAAAHSAVGTHRCAGWAAWRLSRVLGGRLLQMLDELRKEEVSGVILRFSSLQQTERSGVHCTNKLVLMSRAPSKKRR